MIRNCTKSSTATHRTQLDARRRVVYYSPRKQVTRSVFEGLRDALGVQEVVGSNPAGPTPPPVMTGVVTGGFSLTGQALPTPSPTPPREPVGNSVTPADDPNCPRLHQVGATAGATAPEPLCRR